MVAYLLLHLLAVPVKWEEARLLPGVTASQSSELFSNEGLVVVFNSLMLRLWLSFQHVYKTEQKRETAEECVEMNSGISKKMTTVWGSKEYTYWLLQVCSIMLQLCTGMEGRLQ